MRTIHLAAAKAQGRLWEYLNRAVFGPKLLVVDEIGHVPAAGARHPRLTAQLRPVVTRPRVLQPSGQAVRTRVEKVPSGSATAKGPPKQQF